MQVITPTAVADASFTRASSARYFNSSGVLSTAANDVLRINYDPSNLTAAPYALVEPAATNLLLHSEAFENASWIKVNSSVTVNASVAPDGTTTADKLVESTANGGHYIEQYPTISATSTYARTVFVKAAEKSKVRLEYYSRPTDSIYATVSFDMSTGLFDTPATGGGATQTYSAQQCANGWWRLTQIVALGGTDTTCYCRVALLGSGSTLYTGDGVSGVYLWGAQLELGTISTSYIPTTTATVTRAADVAGTGLLYSTLTEPDAGWPTWSSGTTYAIDAQVTYNHRKYKSLQGANTNKNPETDTSQPPFWVDQGPSNKYAMFDKVVGTSSTASNQIILVYKAADIGGAALMQMANIDTAKICVTVDNVPQYQETISMVESELNDWFEYFNLPIVRRTDVISTFQASYGNVITIVLTGVGTINVGNVVLGSRFEFYNGGTRSTQSSPTVGIVDYGIKTVDSFGNTTITPRGYAKRMNAKLMIDSTQVDRVASKLTTIRSTPCVWIGADNDYQALIVYGYYKDWEVEIAYKTKSYCSLQIEGLI